MSTKLLNFAAIQAILCNHFGQDDIEIAFEGNSIRVTNLDEENDNDDNEENDNVASNIVLDVVAATQEKPMAASALAQSLGLDVRKVAVALLNDGSGKVQQVAPTLENGNVYPMWMATGTAAFSNFVEMQAKTEAAIVEKFGPTVAQAATTRRMAREDLINRACQGLNADDAKIVRQYNRTLCYALAEQKVLYHYDCSWSLHRDFVNKAKADEARRNNDLARAIHEVASTEPQTFQEIQGKLPGPATEGQILMAVNANPGFVAIKVVEGQKFIVRTT